MPFDWQTFILHFSTKKEALDYIRKEASEGRALSPKALQELANIFDPGVDRRGQPHKSLDFKLLEAAGTLRAAYQYFPPSDNGKRSESWKDLLSCVSKQSIKTIDRQISDPGGRLFYISAYLKTSFRFWAMGKVARLRITKNISPNAIKSVLIELLLFKEITPEQFEELSIQLEITPIL